MARRNRDKHVGTRSAKVEQPSSEQQSSLLKWGLPAITGAGVFAVYLRTLVPSLGGGDSGELVTVACASAVAHPPGYPLFTILAKLFTLLPFGTVAWRVNLLSALCGSAAAVMILLTVRRWTKNSWAGLLAAGLLAFSPLVWRYAVVAEVFSLNHLLVATLLYTAVSYAETRDPKFAYLSALVFGLGMSNHHTCLFYGIPIMLWVLITGRRELFTARRILVIAGCFIGGLLPYVYLPLADAYKPAASWGNTSTIEGFLIHLLRREYGTLKLGAHALDTTGNFAIGLKEYFSSLPHQVFYVGVPLAIFGLYHGLRQKRYRLFVGVTLIAYCFYLITFHALANLPLTDPLFLDIHRRFWPLANLMVCVWAGLGFNGLAALIPQGRSRNLELAAIAVAIVIAAAVFNFQVEDQRDNTVFSEYGRELFRALPQGSILWTKGDLVVNVLNYLQQCEAHRPDVRMISRDLSQRAWAKRLINHRFPDISIPGPYYGPASDGYNAKQFFDANIPRFSIYVLPDIDIFDSDRSWERDYAIRPMGSFGLVSKQSALDPQAYIRESEMALPVLNVDLLERYPVGSWENAVLKDYWTARLNRANFLISHGMDHGNDRTTLEAGAAALEGIMSGWDHAEPILFKRLGLAYSKLSAYHPAYEEKMKVQWRRYLNSNPPPNDPDLAEIRRSLN
jgi:hypothetical protein